MCKLPKIIVGFDGSTSARETVAWALEEAEVHGWDLKVITVLEQQPVPSTWGAPVYVPVITHDLDSLKTNAQQAVDDIVNTRHRAASVPVTVITATGQPAAVLIHESEVADHLVVGCRGMGGFGRLMLGSVSTQVVHHAACPVTVIHHERRPGGAHRDSNSQTRKPVDGKNVG